MKLSTRLLLLILGCLVPILAAQFYTLARQHADRRARQGDTVLWQAELAMNDLSGVIEGVRRLSRIAARLPNIRQPEDANCTAELGTLQHDLPSLSFVAIVDGAGRLLCGSHPILAAAWNTPPAWLPDLKDGDGIGRIGTVAGLVHPFLPIATASPAVGDNRAIIAALDLDWLSTHLAELRPHRPDVPIRPLLFIVDPDGTIVGMDANAGPTVGIGTRLPEILRPLVAKTSADQLMIEAPQGLGWLSATVPAPAAAAAAGLRAITTIGVPSPLTSFAAFVVWDVLLTGGCALMALILTWQAGHRFIYQPTEMLLLTAQRWRDGDLNVRAGMTGRGSEFDSLAQSFNAMASSLQARDQERRLQAELLESLVAERTRALSEINNRLQVEVA